MTDKMKHCSIEQISKDLYRLKIITAFKDEHTMTITKETLNALMNLSTNIHRYEWVTAPDMIGGRSFALQSEEECMACSDTGIVAVDKTYDEFGDVEWEDPVFCSCVSQEEEK